MRAELLKKAFLFLSIFSLVVSSLPAQSEDRFFDTAEKTSDELRLTIFYPALDSIQALVELRKQGFLPQSGLQVIGVYHEKETTDYQKSKDFVRENNLEWIVFHRVSGELSPDVLYQKNPCTADFEQIFEKSDGIIFFGGADIPPQLYQKKTNLLTHIHTPYRHFLELSMIFHLIGGFQDKDFKPFLESSPGFPVFGICLGAQSLNIASGGTLVQDIWFEKYGKKYFEDVIKLKRENWHTNPVARLLPQERLFPYSIHPIKFKRKGKLWTMLGFSLKDTPRILSAHHQTAGKLGKGMRVAATSLDGKVVEAIEHEKYPNILGVQFHPEFPVLWDRERKIRFTPQEEEISLPSLLERFPPSFSFHKKLWGWFSQRLEEYHRNKQE